MQTNDIIEKRMRNIEALLEEINSKIDNFLGYEIPTDEEIDEIADLRKQVSDGDYLRYEDVFDD